MLKETKAVFAKFAAIISLCAVLTFSFSPEVAFATSGASAAERINCGDEDCTGDVYDETIATYESENVVEASQQSASRNLPNTDVILQAIDNINFTTDATKMQHVFEHDRAAGDVTDKSSKTKFDHDENNFVVLERGVYNNPEHGKVEYIVLGDKSRTKDQEMYNKVAEKSAANLEKQTKLKTLSDAKDANKSVSNLVTKANYAQAIAAVHPEIHDKAKVTVAYRKMDAKNQAEYSVAMSSNKPNDANEAVKHLNEQSVLATTQDQRNAIDAKINDLRNHKKELKEKKTNC